MPTEIQALLQHDLSKGKTNHAPHATPCMYIWSSEMRSHAIQICL